MAAVFEFGTIHHRSVPSLRRSRALMLAVAATAGVVISFTAVAAAAGAGGRTAAEPQVAAEPVYGGQLQRSGEYVVVGPGDTLHSVAVAHAPDSDAGEVVEAIMVLNGMASSSQRPAAGLSGDAGYADRSVEVGQVLALPRVDP